ncbi:MAG: GGDEF domain-containing protein [Xanthomonadales bacterium]|nr:GGDEF domain-containing protein [Xanthomonadales bacterium]
MNKDKACPSAATEDLEHTRLAGREPGLVVISGTELGEFYLLDDGDHLIIGRDTRCDIVLHRPAVSREHASVIRQGEQVTLRDMGSKNGVFVGEERIANTGRVLRDGDLVTIGDASIKYLDGRSPESDYHERSYRMATQDPLTGTYNRRYFRESLQKLLLDSRSRNQCLSFALVDLDNFKQVNDRWGHDVGDRVLQLAASVLTQQLRQNDLLARIGGEEFAVALPATGREDAVKLLDQINRALAERSNAKSSMPRVTFSAGVVTTDELSMEQPGQDDLFKAADQRLYRAKETGRNRILGDLS